MRPRRTCPSCGAARVVPISYGEPTALAMRAAELGLVLTWGCVMHGDLPRWACLGVRAPVGPARRRSRQVRPLSPLPSIHEGHERDRLELVPHCAHRSHRVSRGVRETAPSRPARKEHRRRPGAAARRVLADSLEVV
jgi:hypothetical protein